MQAADHNNEMKIGVRIRALRKARGITLTEMAEKTELSTGYLSKLENDQTSPTLVHLQKLCTAMDITLNDILSPEEPSGGNLPVVRAAERPVIFRDGTDVYYEAVTEGDTAVKVSAMHLVSDRICQSWPHAHDELGIVVSGRLRITVEGVSRDIEPGDSIYVRAGSAHSVQRLGTEECVSYWIKPAGSLEQYGCHIK